MSTRVLVIAGHPDDEVLGCGGTIAKLTREGCDVFTLILGEGITSRVAEEDRRKKEREIYELKKQAGRANPILGVKKVFFSSFPDNSFDTVPLLDIVKAIEKVKKEIQPAVVFTHYEKDLNIDHRITFQAAITATRPEPKETVREIYSFEVLSSTEWNCPLTFLPDIYFDISGTLKYKLKAMEAYRSEIRKFPHPRSSRGISINAEYWGMRVGLKYAEAFKCIRILRKGK